MNEVKNCVIVNDVNATSNVHVFRASKPNVVENVIAISKTTSGTATTLNEPTTAVNSGSFASWGSFKLISTLDLSVFDANYWTVINGVPTWNTLVGSEPDIPEETCLLEITEYDTYCVVTGIGDFMGSELIIPATYNNKPVTSIADRAFSECDVTKVTFEANSNVQSIGNMHFVIQI